MTSNRAFDDTMTISRSPLQVIVIGIFALLPTGRVAAQGDFRVTVRRLPSNPIISLSRSDSLGNKVNGPSVIRVPSWIKDPLGKYYLYFAHHKGKYIRLAYADAIGGPWQVYQPGTLRLSQVPLFRDHIASPDVHVDHESKLIRMYFHGSRWGEKQKTSVATSADGLIFQPTGNLLGDAYFRVFQRRDDYYAIDGHGYLNRSMSADAGWTRRQTSLIPPTSVDDDFGIRTNVRIRHSAVWMQDGILYLFYSRKSDAPERILVTRVALTDDWSSWKAGKPIEVLAPDKEYEGVNYPNAPSTKGGAVEVQQLRDPYVFDDNGTLYLFYTIAGEMGIAVAEIAILDETVQ